MGNPTSAGITLLQRHYEISSDSIYVLSLGQGRGDSLDDSITALKERYYRFNLDLEKACFLSSDLSKENDEIQNRVCDFEATAEKLKMITHVYSADRESKWSRGMTLLKKVKILSSNDVLQCMDSILKSK